MHRQAIRGPFGPREGSRHPFDAGRAARLQLLATRETTDCPTIQQLMGRGLVLPTRGLISDSGPNVSASRELRWPTRTTSADNGPAVHLAISRERSCCSTLLGQAFRVVPGRRFYMPTLRGSPFYAWFRAVPGGGVRQAFAPLIATRATPPAVCAGAGRGPAPAPRAARLRGRSPRPVGRALR